jgi:LEA14-like dessication related protein
MSASTYNTFSVVLYVSVFEFSEIWVLIRDQDSRERRQLSERLHVYDVFMYEVPVKFWNKQFKWGRM